MSAPTVSGINLLTCATVGNAITNECFVHEIRWYGAVVSGSSFVIEDNATTPNVIFEYTIPSVAPTTPLIFKVNKLSPTGFNVTTLSVGTLDIVCVQDAYAVGATITMPPTYQTKPGPT